MKKLIAIFSMLFLLPFSAFGLTMMDDSQMNNVTAQAGVTIAPDVKIGMHVDTIAWGDGDGVGADGGGWVGVSDLNAELFVGVRSDIASRTGGWASAEAMTIDVATDTSGLYHGASYVRIGLGTLEISGSMNMDFELGATNALGQELGTLDILGLQVLGGNGSYVDITTAGRNSGVTLNMNVILDSINMGSLAWGDSDGMLHVVVDDPAVPTFFASPADAAGGYVGLADFAMTDLAISGMVSIDVLTLNAANIVTALDAATGLGYQQLALQKLANFTANNAGDISATTVVLSLGNGTGTVAGGAGITDGFASELGDIYVTMGTLSADVALSSLADADLRNSTDVLGSIYISGAEVAVDGIVAIGAH